MRVNSKQGVESGTCNSLAATTHKKAFQSSISFRLGKLQQQQSNVKVEERTMKTTINTMGFGTVKGISTIRVVPNYQPNPKNPGTGNPPR